jgi:hypothetical protein
VPRIIAKIERVTAEYVRTMHFPLSMHAVVNCAKKTSLEVIIEALLAF